VEAPNQMAIHLLTIDSQRQNNNLSSAIRLYVLSYYRERCDAKQ
jgi:predicted DNA-binding ribbon-helix-helix protein